MAGRCPRRAARAQGRSTLDLFGDGFALLAFGGAETEPLQSAARSRGVPLRVTTIDDAEIARLYGARLVVVRPDGHVGWRGDAVPDDAAAAVIDRLRGAA